MRSSRDSNQPGAPAVYRPNAVGVQRMQVQAAAIVGGRVVGPELRSGANPAQHLNLRPGAPPVYRAAQSNAPAGGSPLQARFYDNVAITNFIGANPQQGGESRSAYLARATGTFKQDHQYHDRDDLRELRKRLVGHRSLLVRSDFARTKNFAADFDAHVLGDSPGVGWHTERSHANGTAGYSYSNPVPIGKGCYRADHLTVRGTAKGGNGGVGHFFPATMTIAEIRSEAEYVANNYPQVGQLIEGRANRSGIVITCLMQGTTIVSAYPKG